MFLSIKKAGQSKNYWQQEQKILLAVSGGVDSMVLLHIVQKLQQEFKFSLGVAHVNHQLRKESFQEEQYLKQYCQTYQLPLFSKRWEQPVTTGMEAAARSFRYDFFADLMKTRGYQLLMTAHHQDDRSTTGRKSDGI